MILPAIVIENCFIKWSGGVSTMIDTDFFFRSKNKTLHFSGETNQYWKRSISIYGRRWTIVLHGTERILDGRWATKRLFDWNVFVLRFITKFASEKFQNANLGKRSMYSWKCFGGKLKRRKKYTNMVGICYYRSLHV